MIELKSPLDKDTFFLVQTVSFKNQLEKLHPAKAVYLPYEVPFLKNLSKESLISIHLMKKNFQGLILSSYVKKNHNL